MPFYKIKRFFKQKNIDNYACVINTLVITGYCQLLGFMIYQHNKS
jgi:hypothetical protein